MKKHKCDFGVGDRVALINGAKVGTVIDIMKSSTQEGSRAMIRTLLLVRWDKDEECRQPWNTWEEEYDLDYERSNDEESTMTEEFMDELTTVSLGEVMGVLLMEYGLARVLNIIAQHYLEEQESLDLMDRFGDRP